MQESHAMEKKSQFLTMSPCSQGNEAHNHLAGHQGAIAWDDAATGEGNELSPLQAPFMGPQRCAILCMVQNSAMITSRGQTANH